MAKNKQANVQNPPSAFRFLMAGFTLILSGVLMLPFTVLFLFGMLPTMAAWVIDHRPEKNASVTVALMNFCGVVPNLLNLWSKGGDMSAAIEIIKDPFNLLCMYGAAGMGWLLIAAMPPVMFFLIGIKREESVRQLTQRMQKLQEEWGDAIRQANLEISPDIENERLESF